MTVIRMVLGCALLAGISTLNAQTPFTQFSGNCTKSAGGSCYDAAPSAQCSSSWYCPACPGPAGTYTLTITARNPCPCFTVTASTYWVAPSDGNNPPSDYIVTGQSTTTTGNGLLVAWTTYQSYCWSQSSTTYVSKTVICGSDI
jgi:hypothetical protein